MGLIPGSAHSGDRWYDRFWGKLGRLILVLAVLLILGAVVPQNQVSPTEMEAGWGATSVAINHRTQLLLLFVSPLGFAPRFRPLDSLAPSCPLPAMGTARVLQHGAIRTRL
jgi:hypothetical protein